MRGQLYQECPECGNQPVCIDCHLCAAHCICDAPQKATNEPTITLLPARWDRPYRGQDGEQHTRTEYRGFTARIIGGAWEVGTEEWTYEGGARTTRFVVAISGVEETLEQAQAAAESAINELAQV